MSPSVWVEGDLLCILILVLLEDIATLWFEFLTECVGASVVFANELG